MHRAESDRGPSGTVFQRVVRLTFHATAAFLMVVSLAACGNGGTTLGADGSTSGTGEPVSFTTDDGLALDGYLFGSGEAGVILAHMYPADQASWYAAAERLAGEGYHVLTFDFRGYGRSAGEKEIERLDRDVFAALIALADAGANQVVMLGASMGGTASLIAADQAQTLSRVAVRGVVTLSAPVEFRGLSAVEAVPGLRQMPLLFIAAQDDAGATGAKELQALAGGAGNLQIVPGADHGTDLLSGEQADRVWGLLLGFLETNLPVPTDH